MMANHSPDYSDDDFDFVEEYFSRTYQPLSNLPTPPPSSRESLASQSPRTLLEDGGLLDSALLGPAIHLVNLIPPAASITAPSVPLVHEMLVRADLPTHIIALAVCILDSLGSKFSLNWRLLCPLAQREPAAKESTKRHTIQASPAAAQLHIDSVSPEVIALGALVIAFKFVVDCHEPTRYYRDVWGRNTWTSDQINVTERCILEDLGCRILPLWDPALIADATGDMQRAARQATAAFPSSHHPRNGEEAHKRSVSSGEVLLSVRTLPLTPAETPTSEDGPTVSPV
ncbi:hypothetical protein N658DRAFT_484568 [Parathielavia hyrcaniae]|uniref:Cyclin N-terminal domain-containing protein n=1 Tax=Parathielavia hyrcaniae TaxID=113614 RepID=A0AAN6Q7L1_9PEZI|nr:hypothetical protein N658DRAFT_484568 [Parathielavia hyrcaniae]